MIERGIEPDVVTYSCIVDALCKVRAMDKAELILPVMVDKVGKMDEATRVLDSLLLIGLEPDIVTYNTLLSGYCKTGRIDNELSIFWEMSLKGVKPTTVTYSVILDGLFQAGRIVAAKEKFQELIENAGSIQEANDLFASRAGGRGS
ncbi:hypothetical protein PR202_ga00755 [Eleusine coracana subsp. coracana]|uniref:Pentatricopeptide repeat-containing protein n=1 Tax=Eleusine coracana subsp. coracana TaxID=191504 RepID=A0AAV5BGM5_ELECO|nr:hypothetical protein PR202_ga00755 [Eleusine coracana subsp. coracana]